MTGKVLYEKRGALAYVTLNRPEGHNCIDTGRSAARSGVWDEVKRGRETRCAILTGAGARAFCSGADLTQLIPAIREASEEDNRRRAFEGPGWGGISGGYRIHTPIVAAINGYCIAGGHELAEFCDIRIAAAHATFGHQEIRWGLMPGDGGCSRLPRTVRRGRARGVLPA